MTSHLFARTVLATMLLAGASQADTLGAEATAQHLSIELNALEQVENACQFSFLIDNKLGADLTKAVFETVLFDATGTVERLTLFDFGSLPQDRARVRQFALPDRECAAFGSILFNGATTCSGEGLDPSACESFLNTSSKTSVELK